MIELKPCPFCGNRAEIQEDHRWPRAGKFAGKRVKAFEVICPNWDCPIYHADNTYFLSEKEAAEAWNRRADNGRI